MARKKTSRVVSWTVRLVLLVILIVGIVLAFRRVQALRIQILQQAVEKETKTEVIATLETAEREVARSRPKVERIRGQLISPADITAVIGALEAEGQGRGITLEFSDVVEKQTVDAKGNPVVPTGPVRDIVISFTANGPPEQLIAFLGAVEHLPWFVFMETWEFQTEELSARPQPSPTAEGGPPARLGRLTADVTVVVTAPP